MQASVTPSRSSSVRPRKATPPCGPTLTRTRRVASPELTFPNTLRISSARCWMVCCGLSRVSQGIGLLRQFDDAGRRGGGADLRDRREIERALIDHRRRDLLGLAEVEEGGAHFGDL